jgi:hypothetical protein
VILSWRRLRAAPLISLAWPRGGFVPNNLAYIDLLIQRLEAMQQTALMIDSSITFDRERGFDRHCTTQSRFCMVLRSVSVTMSGMQLRMSDGQHTWYGISLPKVAFVQTDSDGNLEVIENLAATVARRTMIS